MKTYKETDLKNFDAWSGAEDTKERIINEGKEDEFNNLIDELYPDGIDETHLNDLLRFDDVWLFEVLGITEEDEEDEEDED